LDTKLPFTTQKEHPLRHAAWRPC